MQISDIMQSVSSMSEAELMEQIRLLRRSRGTKKEISNKSADRPKTKEKKQDNILDLLGALSSGEKERILSKLLGVK